VLVWILASRYTIRFKGRSDSSKQGGTFTLFVATSTFALLASLIAFVVARFA